MARIPLRVAQRSLDPGSPVNYPSGSPVGGALAGLGNTIQDAGASIKAKQDRYDAERNSEIFQLAEVQQRRREEREAFEATRLEEEFDAAVDGQAAELLRTAPMDGQGLHDAAVGQVDDRTGRTKPGLIDNLAKDFLKRVPPSQRERFQARLEQKRMRLSNRMANAQFEVEQTYYTNEANRITSDLVNKIILTDPNDTATVDEIRERGFRAIETSGMLPAQKEAFRQKWASDSGQALAQSFLANDPDAPSKLRAMLGFPQPQAQATAPVQGEGAIANVVDRIIGVESSGDPNAKNDLSSAEGLGQFIDRTWIASIRKHRPDIAAGRTPDQILALKRDPALSRELTVAYARDNAEHLTNRSVPVTASNLYLAHFAGAGGAVLVLKADPDDSVASILGQDKVRANPFLRGMTAADLIRWTEAKMGGSGVAPVTRATGPDLPVVTAGDNRTGGGPDIDHVTPQTLGLFKQLQNAFGQSIPIASGFRDPGRNARAGGASKSRHMHGDALDLDVSKMSKEERVNLIRMASSMGFQGIGVYNNSLHLDLGNRRAWGPSHGRDSVPGWAQAAIAEHEAGKATAPAGGGSTLDPRLAGISPDDRMALLRQVQTREQEQRMEMRAGIEIATTNAPIAYQTTGSYSGHMPTPEEFVDAYGVQEGAQRYNQFEAAVETSRTAYDMQTMPTDQVKALVQAAVPTSTGEDAALQQQRHSVLSSAAEQTLKAREADPAAYVQQVFPRVRVAWQDAQTPAGVQQALAVTAAAQKQLGIANMHLLPDELADRAANTFKDEQRTEGDRIAAATQLVLATPDAEQRRAVFNQLVDAGLPDITEGAIEAMARGDQGAARRLFEAALVDMSKLPGKTMSGGLEVTSAQIDEEIQTALMDEGMTGDVYYGLSDGSAENFIRAQRDSKLLTNAVHLRIRNGESLQAAVSAASKDLYGDVKVETGDNRVNARILLPSGVDPEPVLRKLEALQPRVSAALAQTITVPEGIGGEGQAITRAVRDNYTGLVLDNGHWRSAEGGFVFIDPYVGAAVSDPSGEPIIFRLEDAIMAPLPPIAPAAPGTSPDALLRRRPTPTTPVNPAAPMEPGSSPDALLRQNLAPMPAPPSPPTLQDRLEERQDKLFENAPEPATTPWNAM